MLIQKIIMDIFKERKNKTISIRISSARKELMKVKRISPTKIFDMGLGLAIKKNKLDADLERIFKAQDLRRKQKFKSK